MFIGNVMTSRINRDSIRDARLDASRRSRSPTSSSRDDPWFRPVDIQLGPDGALYIADFYNRIIGHYEVPLDHPGRDRTAAGSGGSSTSATPGNPPRSTRRPTSASPTRRP